MCIRDRCWPLPAGAWFWPLPAECPRGSPHLKHVCVGGSACKHLHLMIAMRGYTVPRGHACIAHLPQCMGIQSHAAMHALAHLPTRPPIPAAPPPCNPA
eukprot:2422045-Prorocentrum_lima.AAC.1